MVQMLIHNQEKKYKLYNMGNADGYKYKIYASTLDTSSRLPHNNI